MLETLGCGPIMPSNPLQTLVAGAIDAYDVFEDLWVEAAA